MKTSNLTPKEKRRMLQLLIMVASAVGYYKVAEECIGYPLHRFNYKEVAKQIERFRRIYKQENDRVYHWTLTDWIRQQEQYDELAK